MKLLLHLHYSEEALEVLKGKKNRIILILKDVELPNTTVRTCLNGCLVQDKDAKTDQLDELKTVT